MHKDNAAQKQLGNLKDFELADPSQVEALAQWLQDAHGVTIAEELPTLDPEEQAVAFRMLPKKRALDVFEYLDPIHQQNLLKSLQSDNVTSLVKDMQDDNRARLFDEMPAKVASRLLLGLPPKKREHTQQLLGYPPDSAGRVMTPAPTLVDPEETREQVLTKLQRYPLKNRDIAVLPVKDKHRHLLGVVNLADIVTAPEGTQVKDLMSEDTHHVNTSTDQEEAARLIQEADLLGLPVVDDEGRVVGLITVDDAMEILEREATEDAYRAGGSEPLNTPYLSARIIDIARKRGVWLILLIFAAVLTVNVMSHFEDTLDKVVVLAVFVPLIIGTGGNAGAQAASSVIRALAVDEVQPKDVYTVLWREMRLGMILGAFLGLLVFIPLSFIYDTKIAVTIGLSIFFICIWACLVGGVLPLVARKIGVDPAVFSTPVVSTLVDATGLIIYFMIAQAVLSDVINAS